MPKDKIQKQVGTGSSIVQYGSYDIADANEAAKQADSIAGGVYLGKLRVGDTILRVLPPLIGRKAQRVTALHYIDPMPGIDKIIVFACPRHELKQECIACTRAEQLRRSPSPLDRDAAWRISAQLKVYVNVVDRDNEDAGVKVWGFGKNINEQLHAIRRNPRMGGDYTDPTASGFDLIVNRIGTGQKDTKYMISAARDNTPLSNHPEQMADWINKQHDLDALVSTETPDELLAAWADLAQASRGSRQSADRQLPSGREQEAGRSMRSAPSRTAVIDAQAEEDEDDADAWMDE